MFGVLLKSVQFIALMALVATASPSSSPSEAPSIAPTTSKPSFSPTTSTPTQTPTVSPTLNPSAGVGICETDTYGPDNGGIVALGAAADGTNFTGAYTNPFVSFRSNNNKTVIVYQSDAVQTIQARFATSYANNNQLNTPNGPNMTWDSTIYGLATGAGLSLKAVNYGPTEVAILYTESVGNTVRMRTLNTKTFALGTEYDTTLTSADVAASSKIFNGYYFVAQGGSPSFDIKIVRTITTIENGTKYISFSSVGKSTLLGATPVAVTAPTSVSVSAMDAKGIIAVLYAVDSSNLAAMTYDSTGLSHVMQHKLLIPLQGSTPLDFPKSIVMASPKAGVFFFMYVDSRSPNSILAGMTSDSFATVQTPTVIGYIQGPKPNPGTALIYSSTNVVEFWELHSPNAYARKFNWNNNSITTYPNASFGQWSPNAVLMFTAPYNWSKARVSGTLQYGFNLVADTSDLTPSSIQLSNCGVYKFTNSTKSAAVSVQASTLAMGLIALAVLVAA